MAKGGRCRRACSSSAGCGPQQPFPCLQCHGHPSLYCSCNKKLLAAGGPAAAEHALFTLILLCLEWLGQAWQYHSVKA